MKKVHNLCVIAARLCYLSCLVGNMKIKKAGVTCNFERKKEKEKKKKEKI